MSDHLPTPSLHSFTFRQPPTCCKCLQLEIDQIFKKKITNFKCPELSIDCSRQDSNQLELMLIMWISLFLAYTGKVILIKIFWMEIKKASFVSRTWHFFSYFLMGSPGIFELYEGSHCYCELLLNTQHDSCLKVVLCSPEALSLKHLPLPYVWFEKVMI